MCAECGQVECSKTSTPEYPEYPDGYPQNPEYPQNGAGSGQ